MQDKLQWSKTQNQYISSKFCRQTFNRCWRSFSRVSTSASHDVTFHNFSLVLVSRPRELWLIKTLQ